MNKLNTSDILAATNDFANLSYKDKGSFSYACGTFQFMLATIVSEQPKHKQAEFLKTLEQAMKHIGQPA